MKNQRVPSNSPPFCVAMGRLRRLPSLSTVVSMANLMSLIISPSFLTGESVVSVLMDGGS